ncbi:hypothetical protein GGR53DRAFT_180630 [Hypoxylon sp. FL1150]|nr:hypothetical protein GGR53DRAFT_180630 [Hypoxylon sp. FL1150]
MGPKPRLDPYMRLLHRFYEPLILLLTLGKTRGEHTSSPWDATPEQAQRRRLLRNFAYLCDYEKGGDTTTSIGLEENDERFVFWIASNTARSGANIVRFLEDTLPKLRKIFTLGEEQRDRIEKEFVRECITFAKSRVKKEIKLLAKFIAICKQQLDGGKSEADSKLLTWLGKFNIKGDKSVIDVCLLAYDQRKPSEMRWLKGKFQARDGEAHLTERVSAFEQVYHYLGRLAHHVRAPIEVVQDSSSLSRLFDEYDIRLIERVESNPRPEADSMTNLPDILKRMLPANDPGLKQYRENIQSLDQKFNITARIQEKYDDKNFQPQIHAEIQVLEHFYANRIGFADDDRYVGCSKPACYCCHLYFQHHKARPVVPESHQNIYRNWGLRALPEGAKDPGYVEQRNLINKMLEAIRQDALGQIRCKASPPRRHADSRTGITVSTMEPSLDMIHPRKHSPEKGLISLDVNVGKSCRFLVTVS